MKRQLDLHGNVVASFCPTTMDALTVSRRGAHREASCQMDTIGLDLHKRESQLCIGHADGTITERRIVTSRERFRAVLGNRPRARVLLEASTESEWVAQHLEGLGHEVIVADRNYAPMYATRSRRVKTDSAARVRRRTGRRLTRGPVTHMGKFAAPPCGSQGRSPPKSPGTGWQVLKGTHRSHGKFSRPRLVGPLYSGDPRSSGAAMSRRPFCRW